MFGKSQFNSLIIGRIEESYILTIFISILFSIPEFTKLEPTDQN